jgi:hypothetical protein
LLAHGQWFSPGTAASSTTIWNTQLVIDFDFWCFNATFSNISAKSWRPVLVVEEAAVPGENH